MISLPLSSHPSQVTHIYAMRSVERRRRSQSPVTIAFECTPPVSRGSTRSISVGSRDKYRTSSPNSRCSSPGFSQDERSRLERSSSNSVISSTSRRSTFSRFPDPPRAQSPPIGTYQIQRFPQIRAGYSREISSPEVGIRSISNKLTTPALYISSRLEGGSGCFRNQGRYREVQDDCSGGIKTSVRSKAKVAKVTYDMKMLEQMSSKNMSPPVHRSISTGKRQAEENNLSSSKGKIGGHLTESERQECIKAVQQLPYY